jgi:hypothetical protein
MVGWESHLLAEGRHQFHLLGRFHASGCNLVVVRESVQGLLDNNARDAIGRIVGWLLLVGLVIYALLRLV